MAIKKEGASTTCKNCDSDLICRLKDYGGNFAPALQWQNFDGTAHYKTTDGKNFNCNIPDDDESEQTRIPTKIATPAATISSSPSLSKAEFLLLVHLQEKIDSLIGLTERLTEMITPMFQKMVDDQIGRVQE